MRVIVTVAQKQWHQKNSCMRGVDGKAMMITDGPGFPAIYTSGNSPITSVG